MYGNGAYTGELSAEMLKDAGINWTIIGHCERRKLFGETDEVVAKKVKQAADHGINSIVCIGETLTERVQRKTDMVNSRMLSAIAEEIDDWSTVSIAYQPVWTIGTGRTASHDQVQETQREIRDWIALNVGYKESETMRIIYGGNITKFNVNNLIK